MTAAEAIRRLRRINLPEVIVGALEETKEEYGALQLAQFVEGQNSVGIELSPYSKAYARLRQRNGLQTEVKDLRFSGEFYENLIVEPFEDVINVSSDVEYERWIDHFYNEDGKLYGLNDDNAFHYRTGPLFQAVKEKIIEQTGLTFI
jgi:hypothetical protein